MANNEESAPIFPLLFLHMREMLSEEVNKVFNKLEVTKGKSFVIF